MTTLFGVILNKYIAWFVEQLERSE